jgi:lipoate-protein ligase A
MRQIRVLDLGEVPAVRSQSIYHAVARGMMDDTPDTIILVSPTDPYVCIGFHQDLDAEVDTGYCVANALPVVRREVGGGAVLLDRDQLFSQWVFHGSGLPASLEGQFASYAEPLVATYRTVGIDAYLRPINDIHVDGKKIGGSGAAQIGEARVLVGSLMFDFDKATMARVLKVPSEKMRDKVFANLEQYMTTMRELLPVVPPRAEVTEIYLAHCAAALDAELVAGEPTPEELEIADRLDRELLSPDWLGLKSTLSPRGVKISADVSVVSGTYKAPGGLIRATATLIDGRIGDVTFTGDFTILPADGLGALEQAACGERSTPEGVQRRLERIYDRLGLQTPGVAANHFVAALAGAEAIGSS